MREPETNYVVLAFVAFVGVVAIFAMTLHTSGQLQTTPSSPAFTGAVTSNAAPSIETTTLPPYSRLDYNADGVLNEQDSRILVNVISVQACPVARECDINQDNRIDEQDLALFNTLLTTPTQANRQTQISPPQKVLSYKTKEERNTRYPRTATRLG